MCLTNKNNNAANRPRKNNTALRHMVGNDGVLAIVDAAARHPTLHAMRLQNNVHTAMAAARIDSVCRALRAERGRSDSQILMRGGMHIVHARMAQAITDCATTRGSDWIRRYRRGHLESSCPRARR